jgi:predicted deacylase
VAEDLKVALHGLLGANAEDNVRAIRRAALESVAAWQPRSDGEAHKKLLQEMAIDADIVLDLHCDNEAVLHIYAGTPLADAVAPLARLTGAHAVLLSTAAGGDPFDEACSRLWWDLQAHFGDAIPIPPACMAATVELRGEMDVGYELAQQDANALLRFLAGEGVLAGETDALSSPLPLALCAATPLEGVEALLAPHAGVLVYTRALGERVRTGDALADIIDPASGAATTVRCTVDGVFFARSAHRHVLRGWNIGKVAGAQAFRSGDLLSQ